MPRQKLSDAYSEQLATHIASIRLDCDLSQAELAERLGVCRSQVANLESGRSGITLAVLVELAKVFECSVHDLMPEEW